MHQRLTAICATVVICAATAFFAADTLLHIGDGAEESVMQSWLQQARMQLSLAMGRDCIGDYYITEERILPKQTGYRAEWVTENIAAVNAYAAATTTPCYWAVAPTAAGIYADMLPAGAPQASEQVLLDTAAASAGSNLTWIALSAALYDARDSYLYYRTDPRWTSYGAFCAYKTVIRKLGFANLGVDRFVIEHSPNTFYGTFCAETGYQDVEPDVVDFYICTAGEGIATITAPRSGESYSSLYRRVEADAVASPTFLPDYEPVLQVETTVHNDKRLLVLSDTYGSSFAPFLTQHYHDLTLVNLELATAEEIHALPTGDYNQILLLCSADTLAKADGLRVLAPAADA